MIESSYIMSDTLNNANARYKFIMRMLPVNSMSRPIAFGIAALSLSLGVNKAAAQIPYANVGTENPVTYTFTAAATGDIVAYYAAQTGASFDEQLGLLVNGVDTGILGLDNHSTATGTALDFGTVTAGSTLTFYINVYDGFDYLGRAYPTPL